VFTHKHPLTKKLHLIYLLMIGGFMAIAIVLLKTLPASASSVQETSGSVVDSLNGIPVYYNGEINSVIASHITNDGYNLGLKWQCVEFVKRYYYYHLHHAMPESGGHAKDFFDKSLPDASYNYARELVQYANPSLKKPAVDDIIVFDGHLGNKYGHIAIISFVGEDVIEIIQQNPGPDEPSRERLEFAFEDGRYNVKSKHVLGWLRIE
jgi:hypothetical protein